MDVLITWIVNTFRISQWLREFRKMGMLNITYMQIRQRIVECNYSSPSASTEYESEPEASEFDLGTKISTPKDVMLEELSLLKNKGSKMFKMRQLRVEKFIYENNPDIFINDSMVRIFMLHSVHIMYRMCSFFLFFFLNPFLLVCDLFSKDNYQKFVPGIEGQMVDVGGHLVGGRLVGAHLVGGQIVGGQIVGGGGHAPVPPPKPGSRGIGAGSGAGGTAGGVGVGAGESAGSSADGSQSEL